MKINIEIFDCLDDIWNKNRGSMPDDEWVKAIGGDFRKPTISELRRLSRNIRISSDERVGRACTLEKILQLYSGLMNLFGGEIVRKDVEKCIEKTTDLKTRILLRSILLTNSAPNDLLEQYENILKTFSKAALSDKN